MRYYQRSDIIFAMIPKILMAPLSGVSDLSFRLICREEGAKFCFFEMLDASTLIYGHPRTMRMIKTIGKDRPIAAQLLGSDPSVMLDAALKLMSLTDISLLDINSACPAPKVLRRGAGAHLLEDPKRLGQIVKRLTSKLAIPVTVKMRTAFNKLDRKKTVRTARICRDNGAAIIFIHGRTMPQGYTGDIDYGVIRDVKEALDIPVYGSGNILNPHAAKKMFDETGCDGILVARGALGNPWLFKKIDNYLKNGKMLTNRKWWIKKRVLKKHLSYIMRYKYATYANKLGIMCKVGMWYMKGLPKAARLRDKLNRVGSYKELARVIDSA